MKVFQCEMCGSNQLMKEGDFYVCQFCHTKYTKEDARAMMIEGTVEVQGTVQVDNSSFVKKYLANARRAKEKEDWEEVEKYYNMVEQNDPDNIEAIFYSAFGKAKTALIDVDIFKRKAVFKVLSNCISVMDDHYRIEKREENKDIIFQASVDLAKMFSSNFVFNRAYMYEERIATLDLFVDLLNAYRETINNIYIKDNQICYHKDAILVYNAAISSRILKKPYIVENWIKKEVSIINEEYWKINKDRKHQLDLEIKAYEQLQAEQQTLIDQHPATIKYKKYKEELDEMKKANHKVSILNLKEKAMNAKTILDGTNHLSELKRIKDKETQKYLDEFNRLEGEKEKIAHMIKNEPFNN